MNDDEQFPLGPLMSLFSEIFKLLAAIITLWGVYAKSSQLSVPNPAAPALKKMVM